MKPVACFHRFPRHIAHDLRPFQTVDGQLPGLQAHSCLRPVQKFVSGHPQIAQRKQRHQLRRVLGKSLVANLGKSELALDDPKRVFNLGTNAGLDLLSLVQQLAPVGKLIQCLAFARAHGHLPVNTAGLWPLHGPLIARICKNDGFFTMQQAMALRHIVDVGRSADDAMHQARICIHADMNTKGLPASR